MVIWGPVLLIESYVIPLQKFHSTITIIRLILTSFNIALQDDQKYLYRVTQFKIEEKIVQNVNSSNVLVFQEYHCILKKAYVVVLVAKCVERIDRFLRPHNMVFVWV